MKFDGVSIAEAAKKYKVSTATVRRWWQTKRIKGKKVCRIVLLDEKDLADYYKKNKVDIMKFSRAYRKGGSTDGE